MVSVCLGETKVLAAVYGPKAGTNKNENPEKACFEVIWKPKTGQIGMTFLSTLWKFSTYAHFNAKYLTFSWIFYV